MAEFQEIYTAYVRRVYRFLLGLTGNSTEAEELTQQTFYLAFRHIGKFEGRSSLYTWLCQIGKNAWLRECRRLSRLSGESIETLAGLSETSDATQISGVNSNLMPEMSGSIEINLIKQEEHRRAVQKLTLLPQPYRDVVILRIYGELPFSEIAALFGKSESWGKVTFFRGNEKLRKMMEDEDDTV